MSMFEEMFEQSLEETPGQDYQLKLALNGALEVLLLLPDQQEDDEVARRQRQERRAAEGVEEVVPSSDGSSSSRVETASLLGRIREQSPSSSDNHLELLHDLEARVQALQRRHYLMVYDASPRRFCISFIALCCKCTMHEATEYMKSLFSCRNLTEKRRVFVANFVAAMQRQAVESSSDASRDLSAPISSAAAEAVANAVPPPSLSAESQALFAVSVAEMEREIRLNHFNFFVTAVMLSSLTVDKIKYLCQGVSTRYSILQKMPWKALNIQEEYCRGYEEQLTQLEAAMLKHHGDLVSMMHLPALSSSQSLSEWDTNRMEEGASDADEEDAGEDSETSLDRDRVAGGAEATRRQASRCSTPATTTTTTSITTATEALSPGEIRALIADFRAHRHPCDTQLFHTAKQLMPDLDGSALSPCLINPRLFHQNPYSYPRVAPPYTANEVASVLHWLQVELTEPCSGSGPGAEDLHTAALARRFAAAPFDPLAADVTLAGSPTNVITARVVNPVQVSHGPVQCDLCNVQHLRLSFQGTTRDGQRSRVCLRDGPFQGFDMCLPCTVFYYTTAETRFVRAVHPNPLQRRPTVSGMAAEVVVWTLSVCPAAASAATAAEQREKDPVDDKGPSTACEVTITMGVSPFCAVPVAWLLPRAKLQRLEAAYPVVGKEGFMSLSEAGHSALPGPPATWKESCSVVSQPPPIFPKGSTAAAADPLSYVVPPFFDGGEECAICLQPLYGSEPVLKTTCSHVFHLNCIGSYCLTKPQLMAEENEEAEGRCPLCRRSDFMPNLTDGPSTMRQNFYRLVLKVDPAVASDGQFSIAVATLLSEDVKFHNSTNFSYCESFHGLCPGYLFATEIWDAV